MHRKKKVGVNIEKQGPKISLSKEKNNFLFFYFSKATSFYNLLSELDHLIKRKIDTQVD